MSISDTLPPTPLLGCTSGSFCGRKVRPAKSRFKDKQGRAAHTPGKIAWERLTQCYGWSSIASGPALSSCRVPGENSHSPAAPELSPGLERHPAVAGLENNPVLCKKAPDPTSHEPPSEVTPLPELQHYTSTQLHAQLNHRLSKGSADPPLSGTARPDSSPSACTGTSWHQQAHQCPPLQHSPNPANLEQQELSLKPCRLLAQLCAAVRMAPPPA